MCRNLSRDKEGRIVGDILNERRAILHWSTFTSLVTQFLITTHRNSSTLVGHVARWNAHCLFVRACVVCECLRALVCALGRAVFVCVHLKPHVAMPLPATPAFNLDFRVGGNRSRRYAGNAHDLPNWFLVEMTNVRGSDTPIMRTPSCVRTA